jgi:hypothetical protein
MTNHPANQSALADLVYHPKRETSDKLQQRPLSTRRTAFRENGRAKIQKMVLPGGGLQDAKLNGFQELEATFLGLAFKERNGITILFEIEKATCQ